MMRKSIHRLERELGFKEWLFNFDTFANWKPGNNAFKIAITPQAKALNNLPDFIGRFENLERDFGSICEHIGIDAPPLLNKNPTITKTHHYSEYYDDEAREFVAN